MKNRISLQEWITMTIAMFLMSAAIYYEMMPNNLVFGSLSGLVLIIVNFIPLKVSVMTLILNIILLVLGYFLIGKDFGLKTVITSLMLPVYLWIFEMVTPDVPSLSGNLVIDIVCFMIIISLGQAMLFNINASSGGLDIIIKILNKYLGLKVGTGLTIAGFLIALLSILVYDRQTTIISIVGTYIYGLVLDHFCDGFQTRKRVCVVSEKYQEIQRYIVCELNRGATLYHAYGGRNLTMHMEVQTILEKNEYGKLLEYVRKEDPAAFVTVSTVNEVIGAWNKKRKVNL